MFIKNDLYTKNATRTRVTANVNAAKATSTNDNYACLPRQLATEQKLHATCNAPTTFHVVLC